MHVSDSAPAIPLHWYGPTLALVLALTVPADLDSDTEVPPAPNLTPTQVIQRDFRLAKHANEPGQIDIHNDVDVLFYLTTGIIPRDTWPIATVRRVLARARRYKLVQHTTGNLVYRLLSMHVTRLVPALSKLCEDRGTAHRKQPSVRRTRSCMLVPQCFQLQKLDAPSRLLFLT